jgi:hypothetical protein
MRRIGQPEDDADSLSSFFMTDAQGSTDDAQVSSSNHPEVKPAAPEPSAYNTGAITLASLWAATSLIVAITLMATTNTEEYGGDAYTGIQNAIVIAIRGISWLLIGSGVIGMILAVRRQPR